MEEERRARPGGDAVDWRHPTVLAAAAAGGRLIHGEIMSVPYIKCNH